MRLEFDRVSLRVRCSVSPYSVFSSLQASWSCSPPAGLRFVEVSRAGQERKYEISVNIVENTRKQLKTTRRVAQNCRKLLRATGDTFCGSPGPFPVQCTLLSEAALRQEGRHSARRNDGGMRRRKCPRWPAVVFCSFVQPYE